MAVFSSGADRGTDPPRSGSHEGALSIIAQGMRVVGELITEGVVKVEGTVEGTIRARREVLVAKGGHVDGDIHTREAVIGGQVSGSILAEERVEVQQGSTVTGDISTKKLVIQEGGEVNGQLRMGEVTPGGSAPPSPATSADRPSQTGAV
jgi:cytoskeletal protein CcmA (bactofilin family)